MASSCPRSARECGRRHDFQIGAIFLAMFIALEVIQRGCSTSFERLQPLAVYAVLARTFFHV